MKKTISYRLYVLCQKFPFLRYLKSLLYFTDYFLLLFIKKPKYDKNRKRKEVLVIYNYAFGDGIIFLCAAKGLRKIYPKNKYNITLICQKGLNILYENENIFDKVIPYDLIGATVNLKTRFSLFKFIRKKYYDIVLDPIGVGECTTNVFMCRAIKAKDNITILDTTLNKYLCPKWMHEKIYTKIIKVTEPKLSLIEYYAEFVRGLGYNNFKIKLDGINVKNFNIKLPKEYFIVFPSAGTLMKRWPVEKYAEIIKRVYKKTKLPLLFCGTNTDIDSINDLKPLVSDIPQYDFVNKTSLLEFIEIIKRAKFVIANDTSAYHIAVTNNVPVTIIAGGYTYDRYVKYEFKGIDKYKKPYIVTKNLDCFNCDNNCKKLKKENKIWPCLESIDVEEAWKVVNRMIDDIRR